MKKQISLTLLALLALIVLLTWSKKPKQRISQNKQNNAIQAPEILPSQQNLPKSLKREQTLDQDQVQKINKDYGTFPPVDLRKTHIHKEHLLQAHQKPEQNSQSISIIGKGEKFNPKSYQSNPSKYLNSVEPGRCFHAAQAAPNTPRLKRVGLASLQTQQNKTLKLQAQTQEGQPVSFTAFDGGHFQNGLSSITVQATPSGVATAEYTPTTGVINQSRVQAASPVNSGTLKWTVFVTLNNQLITNKEEGQEDE